MQQTGIGEILEELGGNLDGLPSETALYRYFSWLNARLSQKSDEFYEKYLPIVEREQREKTASPFLSVITRTQGKRPEMLREMLLTLAGQTDSDFELILVGHKLDDVQRELVQKIIGEQTKNFQKKIRYFTLDTGGRAAPLNVGFSHAWGEYFAVLDDDDIVFDNWVEEFHKAAKKSPGSILHAYVLSQEWKTINMQPGEPQALRAVGAPDAVYCVDFDLVRQTLQNRCPLIGLAFPGFAFRSLGILFDESMTTTEDWDYLTRTALFLGVTDIQTPTSLYRQWTNAENSHSVHQWDEWVKNYHTIRERVQEQMALLPGKQNENTLLEKMLTADYQGGDGRSPDIVCSEIFLNRGRGYSRQDSAAAGNMAKSTGFFDVTFDLQHEKPEEEPVTEIRFDVCEDGFFIVRDVIATLGYDDGLMEVHSVADCTTNGYKTDGAIFFPEPDPMMIWPVNAGKRLTAAGFTGKIDRNMTNELLLKVCKTIGGARFQLFFTDGDSFCEEKSCIQFCQSGFFSQKFNLPVSKPVSRFRLDPGEKSGCFLGLLRVRLVYADGSDRMVPPEAFQTNGKVLKNQYFFPEQDPQLIWTVHSGKPVSSVEISGCFLYEDPKEEIPFSSQQEVSKPGIFSALSTKFRPKLF